MAKILLVEDDNNLREIFEMRLKAEGYTIVSAHDGEEALVVAMREKPDLVISDVMMPKLSGFEMIETLRAAPDMKNVKVIMMTALGQAEDRTQGEKLGVDRYLVKSQVTLEDFVRVTHEVLEGKASSEVSAAAPIVDSPSSEPAASAPASTTPAQSKASEQPTQAEEMAAVETQIDNFLKNDPSPTTSTDDSAAKPTAKPTDKEDDDVVNPPVGAVLSVPPMPDDEDEPPAGGVPVTVLPPKANAERIDPSEEPSSFSQPGVTIVPPSSSSDATKPAPKAENQKPAVDPSSVSL